MDRSVHSKLVGALAALSLVSGCSHAGSRSYRTNATAETEPAAPGYQGAEPPVGSAQLTPPGGQPSPSGQYAPGQQGAQVTKGQQMLNAEVQDALKRAPNLDAKAINVAIQGDSVYLSGYVPTPEQRRLAHDIAHSVEGVGHVYTRDLQVR
jgi:hypothetical protein